MGNNTSAIKPSINTTKYVNYGKNGSPKEFDYYCDEKFDSLKKQIDNTHQWDLEKIQDFAIEIASLRYLTNPSHPSLEVNLNEYKSIHHEEGENLQASNLETKENGIRTNGDKYPHSSHYSRLLLLNADVTIIANEAFDEGVPEYERAYKKPSDINLKAKVDYANKVMFNNAKIPEGEDYISQKLKDDLMLMTNFAQKYSEIATQKINTKEEQREAQKSAKELERIERKMSETYSDIKNELGKAKQGEGARVDFSIFTASSNVPVLSKDSPNKSLQPDKTLRTKSNSVIPL